MTAPTSITPDTRNALLGLGGVLLLFFLSWLAWPSQAPTIAVVTPTKLQESPLFTSAPTEQITLELSSTPPGAHLMVFVDGEPVAVDPTPSKIQIAKGAALEITFVAPGYKPELKTLTADKDQAVSVTLAEQKKGSGGRFNGFR